MGHGEGGDLHKKRLHLQRKEEKAEHEENMIEPLGNDVLEADYDVAGENRAGAFRGETDAWQWIAAGTVCEIAGVPILARLHLPHNQWPVGRSPSHGDRSVAGGQRRFHANAAIAGDLKIVQGFDRDIDQGRIKPCVTCLKRDTFRDPGPRRAQTGSKGFGRQRAQGIMLGAERGGIGIAETFQIQSGHHGFEPESDVEDDAILCHVDVSDRRFGFVSKACSCTQDQEQG
jgi:hypothetical protein